MESQWVPRVRSKAEDRSFPSAKTSVQCSYKIKITKRHMLMILLAKSCLKTDDPLYILGNYSKLDTLKEASLFFLFSCTKMYIELDSNRSKSAHQGILS